jgi:pilus assembly protein CpaC
MALQRQSDFTAILLWIVILWAISISTTLAQNVATIPSNLRAADMSEMASTMDVTLGKSTLLRLPSAISRISVGNPGVADVTLINPSEVYILGKMIGTTNIILWAKGGQTRVIDVTVLMDAVALQNKLQEIMPDEKEIHVRAAGDSMILSGTVANTIKADRAVALADTYVRTSVLGMMMSLQGDSQQGGQGGQGGMQGMQILRQGLQNDENSAGAGAGLGSIKSLTCYACAITSKSCWKSR